MFRRKKDKQPKKKKLKDSKRQKRLLEQYEKGYFLQVDNDIDNKEYLKNLVEYNEKLNEE